MHFILRSILRTGSAGVADLCAVHLDFMSNIKIYRINPQILFFMPDRRPPDRVSPKNLKKTDPGCPIPATSCIITS